MDVCHPGSPDTVEEALFQQLSAFRVMTEVPSLCPLQMEVSTWKILFCLCLAHFFSRESVWGFLLQEGFLDFTAWSPLCHL